MEKNSQVSYGKELLGAMEEILGRPRVVPNKQQGSCMQISNAAKRHAMHVYPICCISSGRSWERSEIGHFLHRGRNFALTSIPQTQNNLLRANIHQIGKRKKSQEEIFLPPPKWGFWKKSWLPLPFRVQSQLANGGT